ncbi:hypothetical protein P8452_45971 [Trifolium repens]|nr:hypothetical protein P8452_45971 [Trifolium repens]
MLKAAALQVTCFKLCNLLPLTPFAFAVNADNIGGTTLKCANGVIREVSCRVQLRQFTCNVAPLSIGTINEFVQAFPISAKDEEVGEIPVAFVVIAQLRCETGCSTKEGSESCLHRQDTEICNLKDHPKATHKLLDF